MWIFYFNFTLGNIIFHPISTLQYCLAKRQCYIEHQNILKTDFQDSNYKVCPECDFIYKNN